MIKTCFRRLEGITLDYLWLPLIMKNCIRLPGITKDYQGWYKNFARLQGITRANMRFHVIIQNFKHYSGLPRKQWDAKYSKWLYKIIRDGIILREIGEITYNYQWLQHISEDYKVSHWVTYDYQRLRRILQE